MRNRFEGEIPSEGHNENEQQAFETLTIEQLLEKFKNDPEAQKKLLEKNLLVKNLN